MFMLSGPSKANDLARADHGRPEHGDVARGESRRRGTPSGHRAGPTRGATAPRPLQRAFQRADVVRHDPALSRVLGSWQPLHFDVNAPRTEPDWLAEGLIARGTVTILSGDTSSAKSFVSLALAMAVLEGHRTWLGRPVKGPGRVLMVEGEMPRWEVEDRLRRFGLRNDHWPGSCTWTSRRPWWWTRPSNANACSPRSTLSAPISSCSTPSFR